MFSAVMFVITGLYKKYMNHFEFHMLLKVV